MASALPLPLLLLLPLPMPLAAPASPAAPNCGTQNCTTCGIAEGFDTCPNAAGLPDYHKPYSFHISDTTCGSNDPVGVFFDPRHKVYHMGYQMHLQGRDPPRSTGSSPPRQGCGSVVWAHYVSADFLHWARMPPSIWSEDWYDRSSIFSGSATVGTDGIPRLVYPGMCASGCAHGNMKPPRTDCTADCKTGFTYAVAVPSNLSDPLYTNWTKPSYNPVVNDTGLDPSSAWLTAAKEFRFVGNGRAEATGCPGNATTETTPLYGSRDLVSFYKIGCTALPAGDCPTLFPLPPLAAGSAAGLSAQELAALPTHVYKAGIFGAIPNNADTCYFGDLVDGEPGVTAGGSGATVGSWTPKGTPQNIALTSGLAHSAKDFYDPVHHRRIFWTWAKIGSLGQTVPRELTFDGQSYRLRFSPARELLQLRGNLTSSIGPGWAAAVNDQESDEDFGTVVGVGLLPGKQITLKATSASDSVLWFGAPAAAAAAAVVAAANLTVAVGIETLAVNFTSNGSAAQLCHGESQAPHPWETPAPPQCEQPVRLSASDAIDLRLLVDRDILEVYFAGGRSVVTIQLDGFRNTIGIVTAGITLLNASSWEMGSIHTTAADVLRAASAGR
jgi:hypothetical protein